MKVKNDGELHLIPLRMKQKLMIKKICCYEVDM